MTVFTDTFALIAWLSPRDHAHEQVAAYLDGFTGQLVTTAWVLMEVADALSATTAGWRRSTGLRFAMHLTSASPILVAGRAKPNAPGTARRESVRFLRYKLTIHIICEFEYAAASC